MKMSLLCALSIFVIPVSGAAEPASGDRLILASINENYLRQQIVQPKLDESHYSLVLRESMRLLAVDISLDQEYEKTDQARPLINVDQPNLRGD